MQAQDFFSSGDLSPAELIFPETTPPLVEKQLSQLLMELAEAYLQKGGLRYGNEETSILFVPRVHEEASGTR